MLSKKLTFSLTSLIALLAMGLILTPAMAGEFEAYMTPGELMEDVSTTDHPDIEDIQIKSGRDRGDAYPTGIVAGPFEGDATATGPALVFSISFDKVVQLHDDTSDAVTPSQDALGLDDFTADAFDDLGRSLGTLNLALKTQPDGTVSDTASQNTTTIATLEYATPRLVPVRDPVENPGRQFLLKIKNTALQNAYAVGGGAFEIHYLYITLKKGAAVDASPDTIRKIRQEVADFTPDTSKGPKVLRIDLVEEDEGHAQYANITSTSQVSAAANGVPGVVAISRIDSQSGITATAEGPFDVRIILTEEPKAFTKDHIHVRRGTASDPEALLPIPAAQLSDDNFPLLGYAAKGNVSSETGLYAILQPATTGAVVPTVFPNPTGRDNKYHLYKVTITPDANYNGLTDIWVKSFEDKVKPTPNMYHALTEQLLVADTLTAGAVIARDTRAKNGREVLSVPVKTGKTQATLDVEARDTRIKNEPNAVRIPDKLYIPANGYLVLARGKAEHTGIVGGGLEKYSDDANTTFKTTITAAEQIYVVKHEVTFPYPASDFETFFRNGGTIELLHENATGNTTGVEKKKGYPGANDTQYTAGQVIITEVMWGTDASQTTADVAKSQWIELHNTTSSLIGIDKDEWVLAFHSGATFTSSALGTVIDTVGNIDKTAPNVSSYWTVPGESGATEISQSTPALIDLVSMARVGQGTAQWADGTTALGWGVSVLPSSNINGRRIATPGAQNSFELVVEAKPTPKPTPEPMAPVATGSDIMISEIMVASNDGRLPQWIELANVSGAEVSLSGWSVDIDNDATDADVVAESVNITLGDVVVGKDQVVLVVTKTGRNSGVGSGADAQGMLREDRIVNVQSQVSPTDARYSLISAMAFKIALLPPQKGGVVERGDVVGNLNMGWELPMAEGNSRSSLIRREMGTAAEIMGTDAAGWVLASDTSLVGAYTNTYYGNDEDMGTPGYDAGGSLPVELSKFGAKRDPLTGQVTIAWETQSELNNAGFFIKRSQQKDSKFVAVNPTMIPGAGTTSEKQSYTYTDTTAQPNIVYYYQIEDVSLDGHRQTLTRAHRLKGHIGAAGKATTTWGDLKTSRQQ